MTATEIIEAQHTLARRYRDLDAAAECACALLAPLRDPHAVEAARVLTAALNQPNPLAAGDVGVWP